MSTPTVVIKYGGHAMDDAVLCTAFAAALSRLAAQGMRLVVVHGGGPQISGMLKRLNIESHFEQGLRVTDEATMEVVEMVLCGQVNKAVVTQFQRHGMKAVGISGKDAALFQARVLKPELGLVGDVHTVDVGVIRTLLDGGYVPVVAPVAMGPDGVSLNINADTAAGAMAGALRAEYFVLVSDVPGVLDAQKHLLPRLTRKDIAALKSEGVIHSGMIPKVDSCCYALDAGCRKALILDGRAEASLERYLLEGAPLGTVVEG